MKVINYIKKLNWSGYLFSLVLCALGVLTNKNIDTFLEWLVAFLVGSILCLFFLFAGKKD